MPLAINLVYIALFIAIAEGIDREHTMGLPSRGSLLASSLAPLDHDAFAAFARTNSGVLND
jgi:hypothetical protein